MKKAFTLMEVNLAILIMAGGILSVLGLYSLGYRESRQSREDVASAAYADAVLSPLAMALSATNLKWSVFKDIPNYPSSDGWGDYLDSSTGIVSGNPEAKAKAAFDGAMSKARSAAKGSLNVSTAWPTAASGGLRAGLLVMHERNSPVVRFAFRATKNTAELLAMPVFFTEVRFQGLPNE